MANVHGMGEVERGDQNRRAPLARGGGGAGRAGGAGGAGALQNNFGQIPFLNTNQADVNPRTQGFGGIMRTIFCPYFKCISFMFIICAFDTIMFIATLIYSAKNGGLTSDQFLAPSTKSLIAFGARVIRLNNVIVSLLNDKEKP